MKRIIIFDCDDLPAGHLATGVYFRDPLKPEKLRIKDIAELRCSGITVLVEVVSIDDNNVTGVLVEFVDFRGSSVDGFSEGDEIQFGLRKVHRWTSVGGLNSHVGCDS